jgi:hypothetical protein
MCTAEAELYERERAEDILDEAKTWDEQSQLTLFGFLRYEVEVRREEVVPDWRVFLLAEPVDICRAAVKARGRAEL